VGAEADVDAREERGDNGISEHELNVSRAFDNSVESQCQSSSRMFDSRK
jgi:hypothetical protein